MCYIEQRFEQLAMQKADGKKLITKWESDKNLYTSYTDTTVFDFQHFSMHDKSHSIHILQNIELLLGRSRVDQLGAGDLWLLLQAAYFHDIGMSLTSEDMDTLWEKDSKFRQFLKERLTEGRYGDNAELYDAIEYYTKVDQILNKKADFETAWKGDLDEPMPGWPIQLTHSVQYIITEYVRKKHAERSKDYFERIFKEDKNFSEGVIEKRLYNLVGEISAIHTRDFSVILDDLCYEEVAFGDEHIHPRFAAAMLRIGDLLDMDNNRFNLRVLEHRGPLPPKSVAHLHKHKALSHFEITQTAICAQAHSKDFDTCLETRLWYNWIESEVGHLIQNWNRVAPRALTGCLLKKCDLKVYLGQTLFTSRNLDHFNFDNRKMQKLLIGDSIYDCRLDCLREYVQNAIDATKVYLWKRLKENGFDRPVKNNVSLKELLPCDLKEDAILGLPIKITFSYQKGNAGLASDYICIEIQDRGIGMDTVCIEGITTIGKGWRAREEYQDVFALAPKWLRPTGGFGIGIQSAFMITDAVCYTTRSEKESTGHLIRLVSPEQSGNVTQEDYAYARSHGTTVTFRVQAMKFMNYEELGLNEKFVERFEKKYIDSPMDLESGLLNMFNQKNTLHRAIAICREYLMEQIPNAIFPIYIGEKGELPERITSPYLYKQEGEKAGPWQPLEILEFQEDFTKSEDTSERVRYLYHMEIHKDADGYGEPISRIIIWSTKYTDCVCLSFSNDPIAVSSGQSIQENFGNKVHIAFKNIAVPKEERVLRCGRVFLDIMGERAENCLQVSRSRLKTDFGDQFSERLNEYLAFGLDRLVDAYTDYKLELQKSLYQMQEVGEGEYLVELEDITATPDYVRMVFACFLYLTPDQDALWWKALEKVRKFHQHSLDDVSILNLEQPENAAPEAGTDQQSSRPCNAVRCLAEKLSALSSNNIVFFFCADDLHLPKEYTSYGFRIRQDSVKEANLLDALNAISKAPLAEARTAPAYGDWEENIGVVYSYLSQTREMIFPAIWGAAVFGSGVGIWANCRKVTVEGRRIQGAKDGNVPFFVSNLTIYILNPKDASSTPPAESRQYQESFDTKDPQYQKYPVAVSRLPFRRTVPGRQGRVISPFYEELEAKLKNLKETHPTDEELAVRELLRENPNSRALIDWVYRFQIPHGTRNGPQYSTKAEIEDIYLKWVLEYYHDL